MRDIINLTRLQKEVENETGMSISIYFWEGEYIFTARDCHHVKFDISIFNTYRQLLDHIVREIRYLEGRCF